PLRRRQCRRRTFRRFPAARRPAARRSAAHPQGAGRMNARTLAHEAPTAGELAAWTAAAADDDGDALDRLNAWLEGQDADRRIRFGLEHLPGAHALSSSFGAQAAVSLHLLNAHLPGLPVIVVDTGYLFAETYQFIDTLSERLRLNLHIERSARSPAWIEARH